VILLLVLLSLTGPQLPPGITCDMVREQVARYGKAAAFAWAIRQGYSWQQIKEARKCL